MASYLSQTFLLRVTRPLRAGSGDETNEHQPNGKTGDVILVIHLITHKRR